MLHNYKAVLFDLDGTLLDTLEDIGNSVNRIVRRHGFPAHAMDTYRKYVGDGALKLIIRALPEDKRNDTIVRRCYDEFLEDYSRYWNVKTRPYDGIPELLDQLTARGLKMAILSNKPHNHTVKCVNGFLSDWTFDVVLGQRNGIPKKPDPAGALEIVKELNIAPSDFLYLGDTETDLKTSVAAGMSPVGVLWGFRTVEELQKCGANVLIEKPLDVLGLLD